jgi:hypothetical protein
MAKIHETAAKYPKTVLTSIATIVGGALLFLYNNGILTHNDAQGFTPTQRTECNTTVNESPCVKDKVSRDELNLIVDPMRDDIREIKEGNQMILQHLLGTDYRRKHGSISPAPGKKVAVTP